MFIGIVSLAFPIVSCAVILAVITFAVIMTRQSHSGEDQDCDCKSADLSNAIYELGIHHVNGNGNFLRNLIFSLKSIY
jgi:hypothetical protein